MYLLYSRTKQNLLSERLPHFWTKDMRPVNSQDLSPIEILWAILCERTKQMSNPPSTSPGLEKALKDAWKKISTETLRTLLLVWVTESRQSEWPLEKFLYTSLKKICLISVFLWNYETTLYSGHPILYFKERFLDCKLFLCTRPPCLKVL